MTAATVVLLALAFAAWSWRRSRLGAEWVGEVGTGAGGESDQAAAEATLWVNRSVDCPEAPAQAHLPTAEIALRVRDRLGTAGDDEATFAALLADLESLVVVAGGSA